MTDEPLLRPRRLRVPAHLRALRLDQALAELLEGVSRTRLQELIHDGGVRVDGETVRRPSQRLEEARTLEIVAVPRSRERAGAPPGARFEVLHEDEHLIAIAKPPGMVSHPSSVVRGSTVSELAVERFGPLPSLQGADRPGIVHRLDAETSGLMLLARTPAAAEGLLAAFRERRVEKTYLALVHGEPRFDSDWITSPLGRAPGRPDRMSVIEPPEARDPWDPEVARGRDEEDEDDEETAAPGLEAVTYYETRERLAGFALVAAFPRTGRTHQIRVHLTSIGHPLIGERVYRPRRQLSLALPRGAPPMERHALHAAALDLAHPVTGVPLHLECPLWEDMARLLEGLRIRAGKGA